MCKDYFGSTVFAVNIASNFMKIVNSNMASMDPSRRDPPGRCAKTKKPLYYEVHNIHFCDSFYVELPLASLCADGPASMTMVRPVLPPSTTLSLTM